MAGYIGSKSGTLLSNAAERKQTYSITTATTSLTGLAYTPTKVHVFHNGVRLVDGTDYTATNGTSITLTNAAQNGDEVVVISYPSFQVSDTVSAANGGTFAGNVSMSGTLGVTGATTLSSTLGVTGKITSTAGITFGSDTAAANVLDDYEEGTWTPTYLGDSSNPTVSFTTQLGRYTKIGRLVSVVGYLRPSSVSGGSGGLAIGGLPFQNDNVTYTAATVGYVGGWVSNESPTRLLCHPSDPKITVYRQTSSDPRGDIVRVQTSSLANNCELYFSAVYYSS